MRKICLLLAFALTAALLASCGSVTPAPPQNTLVSVTAPAATTAPVSTTVPATTAPTDDNTVDFKTQKELFLGALPGVWHFDTALFGPDVTCTLIIDERLNFVFDHTAGIDGSKYRGKIVPEWNSSDVETDFPDTISLELDSGEISGAQGGLYSLTMVLIDDTWSMRLYHASNYETILSAVEFDGEAHLTREEKEAPSFGEPLKNASFPAAFWQIDHDEGTIWLECLILDLYTGRLSSVEHKTVRYRFGPTTSFWVEGNDLYPAAVYFVETDDNGFVLSVAEPPADDWYEGAGYEEDGLSGEVFSVLGEVPEYRDYLSKGMKALFDGGEVGINEVTCYWVSVGTDHAENFVREIHYAVDVYNRVVYRLDLVAGYWEPISGNPPAVG